MAAKKRQWLLLDPLPPTLTMKVEKPALGDNILVLTPNEYKIAMVEALERRLVGDKQKAEALQRLIFNFTPAAYFQAIYSDPCDGLNHALKQLSAVLRGRIARREDQRRHDARRFQLRSVLGSERFKEVTEIVRSIKCLQLSKTACACPSPVQSSPHCSVPTVIPCPANQLLFHNQLVEVFAHTPVEALADQDWDRLIDQAKEELQEYREWSEGAPRNLVQVSVDACTYPTQSTSVLIEDEDDPPPRGPLAKRRRF